MSPNEGTINPHIKKYKSALYIYLILIACLMSRKFYFTAGIKPSVCCSGSKLWLRKWAMKVIAKESNRHNRKESRGVRYCVKYADNIEPNIPPIATNDQA